MNINDVFQSRFLKASDLVAGDQCVTIRTVRQESVGQGTQARTKLVITFDELSKPMIANATNARTIAGLFGPETTGWVGKQIVLTVRDVEFQGSATPALRVKARPPTGSAPAGESARARLGRICLERCEGDKALAADLLERFTGKRTVRDLDEQTALAVLGMQTFQQRQPGADDEDVPL